MMFKLLTFLLLSSIPRVCEGQEPVPPQAQEAQQQQAAPTPAPTRGVNEGCDFDHESISDENEVSVHITRGVDISLHEYFFLY